MSATDQPVALTVNSFSSVSLDPPLILWSLRSTSPSRRHFEEGKAFAISILGEGQNELAMRFARAVPDKFDGVTRRPRSEEHTSELQSLMRISYAVFCLKKKTKKPSTMHI